MYPRDESAIETLSVERELDELRQRAHRLEREVERCQRLATLGTLAASVAHEFNNLLTPIVSYAQMALHTPSDGEMVTKALRKAIEGSEKASEIASSMLGFIREEDEGCVHVGHALQDALGCLARDPRKDGIVLRVNIGPECWVQMRPVALEQVLLNLILNARDAMLPGGGTLTVNATCSTWNLQTPHSSRTRQNQASNDECVEIELADNGCGMRPEIAAHAFEPFVRDRTRGNRAGRRTPTASTGLGLSICKRLVEETGGAIILESTEGVGTKFTIRLPRIDPSAVETPDTSDSAAA